MNKEKNITLSHRRAVDLFGGKEQAARKIWNSLCAIDNAKTLVIGNTTLMKYADPLSFFESITKSDFLRFLFVYGISIDSVIPICPEDIEDSYQDWMQVFSTRGCAVGHTVPPETARKLETGFLKMFLRLEVLSELCAKEKPIPPHYENILRKRFQERLTSED